MKHGEELTLIQEKSLNSWREFVDYCSGIQEGKYLFRGQSNYSDELNRSSENAGFKRWELQSSFDRTYSKNSHNFGNFIADIVRKFIFQEYFKGYDLIFNKPNISKDLVNASDSEKLKFFQHYGIPTCLIDFTLDPLIALYFAVSTIKYESGGQTDEFPNCYFSIFQLNRKLLNEIVGIKELDNSKEENSFQVFHQYDHFKRYINGNNEYHDFHYWSWIDIPETFPFEWNENMKLQKGCFLLYESMSCLDTKKRSFECMLKQFEKVTQTKSKEPILTIYNIPYKSIFKENLRDGGRLYNGSLYEFMEKNKKLGKYLFNDMQGLKYDIQFRLSVM